MEADKSCHNVNKKSLTNTEMDKIDLDNSLKAATRDFKKSHLSLEKLTKRNSYFQLILIDFCSKNKFPMRSGNIRNIQVNQ